jgi:hypothetical protein
VAGVPTTSDAADTFDRINATESEMTLFFMLSDPFSRTINAEYHFGESGLFTAGFK